MCLLVDLFANRSFQVDVIEIDVLVVDVIVLDVLGARHRNQTIKRAPD
jgi:hypothetical protein